MIYGVGTTIAGLSVSAGMLLVGWSIIEGFAGALMLLATLAIIIVAYDGADRVKAFAIWGAIAAVAAAIGPIVCGFFTTFYTWRYGFFMELIFVFIILIMVRKITESKSPEKQTVDWVGALLAAIGFAAIIMGILQASNFGFASPQVLFPIVIGFLFLMLLSRHISKRQRRKKTPLFKPQILKIKQFTSSLTVTSMQALNFAAILFIFPLFLQLVFGYSAMETGLILMPLSISVLIFSLLGPKLASYMLHKYIVMLGFVIATIGIALLLPQLSLSMTGATFAIPFIFIGTGMGLVLAHVTNLTMSSVKPELGGEASGLTNTMKQLFASLGVALIGAILISSVFSSFESQVRDSDEFTDEEKEFLVEYGIEYIKKIHSGEIEPPDNMEPEKLHALIDIINETTVDSMRTSIFSMLIFMVIGVIASFFLPRKIHEAK